MVGCASLTRVNQPTNDLNSMQEDLPTSCDLSPLYEPSEHMTPFCNAHDGASAASRKRSTSACRHSTAAPVRHSPSGSAAHLDSSPPLPESSSPLPSASSVMAAPLSTMPVRKPLIGDSSCLSYDFACSCSIPENRATNKAPPQPAAPSGVYDGAVLSSKADAVVAIPNYRLGLLGHSTGNESELLFLGLGDQLTAVRWLRENVGFFGGNASRMVLAGHGAGAASVGHWILGTQPEIADVQRFVMISGSPYARYMKNADVTTKNMRILARRVQCESFDEVSSVEEILPCLRRFPSSVLVPRLRGLNGRLEDPYTSMDDIPAANESQINRPRGSLLLGTTSDEVPT
ncbi:hypothetical protein HPB51_025298 [Rhipicephalus microplus]|uniref:Carboxylesterase type B domain-containing protein n=1 Tax=Rhipicephalus microplus TaxID=6941 RepID=A0A9J6F6G3_RHIMP|nr:hypothetical protein HPB51_025298 [Rhipicephalus microplus]